MKFAQKKVLLDYDEYIRLKSSSSPKKDRDSHDTGSEEGEESQEKSEVKPRGDITVTDTDSSCPIGSVLQKGHGTEVEEQTHTKDKPELIVPPPGKPVVRKKRKKTNWIEN